MIKMIRLIHCILIMVIIAAVFSGCDIATRSIEVEYLPGSEDMAWIKNILEKSSPPIHPTIALNHFSDERTDDSVGGVYSRSGSEAETLILNDKPTDILEKILSQQLQKAGFTVITTSGWNLNPDTIPGYLDADFIIGGHLKTFWVESKAGFLTSTIHSDVVYDLIIADARNKKIIWTGQISGHDQRKSLAHTNDYFWKDIQTSINTSLTQAVNQAFHDEDARKAIITLIRIKF